MTRPDGSITRKLAVLGGAPAIAVVLAASMAWACVSHTGPGSFHQRVVNLTGIQEGRVTTDLDKDNVGGSGCLAGSGFLGVCVNQTNVLVGVGIEEDDEMVSEVDGIVQANATTLVAQLTGTYKVRITDQSTCAHSPTFPSYVVDSPVPGPTFAVDWTVDFAPAAATVYYACVLDPAGNLVDQSGGPGAQVRLVDI